MKSTRVSTYSNRAAAKTAALLIASMLGLSLGASGATFFGTTTWSAGFGVEGTFGRSSPHPRFNGQAELEVTVENGKIRFNSIELQSAPSSGVTTSSETFIDPITFAQKTITTEVFMDSIAFSFSSAEIPLESAAGNLEFRFPSAPPITVTGAYMIEGPTESATGRFSTTFAPGEGQNHAHDNPSSGPNTAILDITGFPNQIGFVGWNYPMLGGSRVTPIANHRVDGVDVELEWSWNLNGFGLDLDSATYTAIPEPSAAFLLVAGAGLQAFRRRR